jgi:hypothetical protein
MSVKIANATVTVMNAVDVRELRKAGERSESPVYQANILEVVLEIFYFWDCVSSGLVEKMRFQATVCVRVLRWAVPPG